MRDLVTPTVVFALAATAFGWGGSDLPDAKERDEVSFARRGTLGTDDYVVTNVVPQLPAYMLVEEQSTALVDHAVNRFDLAGDTVFTVPAAPVKREVDPYRAARGLLLVLSVGDGTVPKVSFDGCAGIYTTDGSKEITLVKGVNIISLMEIGSDSFMAEIRELTEVE